MVLILCVAGIAGTLANSAVQHFAGGKPFTDTARNWGRYGVAIACAVFIPVSYASYPQPAADIVALLALTITPSVLAKKVFHVEAPWRLVLALNLVYALVTWSVFTLLL